MPWFVHLTVMLNFRPLIFITLQFSILKTLRPILITVLFVTGIFSIVVYCSCNKNKCGSTTCQNGGTCVSSACVCPTGYSGTSCQTGWSDIAIGTYKCSRANCNPAVLGTNAWTSAVVKNSTNGGYTINITNFDNNNSTVAANIDTFHHIVSTAASATYGINATGDYANGVIKLHFTTSSVAGVGGYQCDMTMVKQ